PYRVCHRLVPHAPSHRVFGATDRQTYARRGKSARRIQAWIGHLVYPRRNFHHDRDRQRCTDVHPRKRISGYHISGRATHQRARVKTTKGCIIPSLGPKPSLATTTPLRVLPKSAAPDAVFREYN